MIKAAEKIWLEAAISYLAKHFEPIFLPSHDLSHHLRVWRISKMILKEIAVQNQHIDQDLAGAVMLASLFHDAGMVVTRKPEHGAESTVVYKDFICRGNVPKPTLDDHILEAIEFHDRKEEFFYQPFTFEDIPDVQTIISIADDIDALGTIGIYRYAEIYMVRDISAHSLGIRILENVTSRYNNFVKACSLFPALIERTKDKYREIVNFFDLYNQQLLLEPVPEEVTSGPIGVTNLIKEFSVNGKIRPENFPENLSEHEPPGFVADFFNKLAECLDEN